MNTRRAFILCILVLVLASLACSLSGSKESQPTATRRVRPTSTPVEVATVEVEFPQPAQPTEAYAHALTTRLALVALEAIEPSGGWQSYTARFALENISGGWQPVTVDSGPGSVSTQEGYTYPLEPLHYDRMVPILYGDPLTIPNGFIIQGSSDDINGFENVLEVFFQVAEGTHPTSITYQNFGTIDLTQIEAPIFPNSEPTMDFARLGDSVEIPGKARLTFAGALRTQYGVYQGLTVVVQMKNLDTGYDTSVEAGCFLIDGWGFIRWNQEDSRFYAGPGQTVEVPLGFYLWDPERAFHGGLDIDEATIKSLLNNAKLICRGELDIVVDFASDPVAQLPPTEAPVAPPTEVLVTEVPVAPPTQAPDTGSLPPFLYDGQIITLQSQGSLEGYRWLNALTPDGSVSLAWAPYGLSGTRWMVHILGGNLVALESMGHLDGPRWLDGHTGDGTVSLAPQIDGFTGTVWAAYVMADNVITLECQGNLDGPRWLDGHTTDGTLGLAWEVDSAHSGAQWLVDPAAPLVQEMLPDIFTAAYATSVANGWQTSAEVLLSQMTNQVTYGPFTGEADHVTAEDDQMIKSITGEKERIEVKPDHCAIWWSWGGEFTGARFSARQDWQLLQGPGDALEGYGMMVRADGTAHYQFDVRDNEQQIALEYYLDGQPQFIQDWTFTDALRPGQVNRLGVVAEGEHFYFLVNGIVVAELYDDRILDGAMGSYFNTCDPDGWTIYETDNFELRK